MTNEEEFKQMRLKKGEEFVASVIPYLSQRFSVSRAQGTFGYDLILSGAPAECKLDLKTVKTGNYFIETHERWPWQNAMHACGPETKPQGCLWVQGDYDRTVLVVPCDALAIAVAQSRGFAETKSEYRGRFVITARGALISSAKMKRIATHTLDRSRGIFEAIPHQMDMFGGTL